jgi:hypothetical protein
MTSAKNRQSYGLTLPPPADSRDSVVSNILSSLATLDETAQLQWIQETSRQVDSERAYQRRENGNSTGRQHDNYNNGPLLENGTAATPGAGYRDRARNGSFSIPAPSPAVPMGRPAKQGFFKRFMGIGPKVPIEGDLLISTQQPKYMVKSNGTVQVHSLNLFLYTDKKGPRNPRTNPKSCNSSLTSQYPRPISTSEKEILKLLPKTSKSSLSNMCMLIAVCWRRHDKILSPILASKCSATPPGSPCTPPSTRPSQRYRFFNGQSPLRT